MSSHALASRQEARNRRRVRRRAGLAKFRDWRTWGVILAIIIGGSLSEAIVGHLWPKAHGLGYFVTHVAVVAVLGALIAVVLITAGIVAGHVRGRRLTARQ